MHFLFLVEVDGRRQPMHFSLFLVNCRLHFSLRPCFLALGQVCKFVLKRKNVFRIVPCVLFYCLACSLSCSASAKQMERGWAFQFTVDNLFPFQLATKIATLPFVYLKLGPKKIEGFVLYIMCSNTIAAGSIIKVQKEQEDSMGCQGPRQWKIAYLMFYLSFCSSIDSKSSNNTYLNIIKILFLLLFYFLYK